MQIIQTSVPMLYEISKYLTISDMVNIERVSKVFSLTMKPVKQRLAKREALHILALE